jgi:hypothetical protein
MVAGAAAYGASIGLWRSPLQSLYVAIKFPLLIGLTTVVTALLNGMLAQLIGARLSFRQSARAVLVAYSILGLILGAFSPLALFMLANLPPADSPQAAAAHQAMVLAHVAVIAFAGVIANIRLHAVLVALHPRVQARRILIAWLAGHLFVGAQLSWNLRPFFGTPSIPVQFVRDEPFDGTFYESVHDLIRLQLSRSVQARNPEPEQGTADDPRSRNRRTR